MTSCISALLEPANGSDAGNRLHSGHSSVDYALPAMAGAALTCVAAATLMFQVKRRVAAGTSRLHPRQNAVITDDQFRGDHRGGRSSAPGRLRKSSRLNSFTTYVKTPRSAPPSPVSAEQGRESRHAKQHSASERLLDEICRLERAGSGYDDACSRELDDMPEQGWDSDGGADYSCDGSSSCDCDDGPARLGRSVPVKHTDALLQCTPRRLACGKWA